MTTSVSQGSSWPWSYGSWIYNYLCNQWLSPLMLWIRISIRAWCTTLCDKFCQWLATGRWFSPGPPVFSTNKTECHDIIEILLKMALNPIKQAASCIANIKYIKNKDQECMWWCAFITHKWKTVWPHHSNKGEEGLTPIKVF